MNAPHEPNTIPPAIPGSEAVSPALNTLLHSDLLTPQTRRALADRLPLSPAAPKFLTPEEFEDMTFLAAVLMAQDVVPTASSIVSQVDARLAEAQGDGWRYDLMPPDGDSYRRGLQGLNETTHARFRKPFRELTPQEATELVEDWRRDRLVGPTWETLSQTRLLEEWLAEFTQYHYADPRVQADIGYVGMADGRGWQAVGLNEREAWEPERGQPSTPLHLHLERHAPDERRPYEEVAQSGAGLKSLAMKRYATNETVDAVVIGTGAGGSPILMRLARAGLSVVGLEAGKFWNPETDFATDENAQNVLYWRDERLSAGDNPLQYGSNNSGVGVGGSTLHYTAYTPRPHRDDFRLHTDFGVGADWPLQYDDLTDYYGEIERFLGVSGPASYPWDAERPAYPLPPLPLNSAAQLMQTACRQLGITTSPAPNAALSQGYYQEGVGWRPACSNRGFCQAGCSIRAKASMDVTFLPVAIQAGAEIRSECFVTQIETDGAGRVTGVVYVRDGREERQPCRTLFLCAGAIETPRLLLINNLGNANGQVGRHFMAHPGLQIWGEFDPETRPWKGIPGGLISEDTHRPKDADFTGGYLLQSIGVMPLTYATQMARGTQRWGRDFQSHMRRYNHFAGINILGDGLPYPHNYLELSSENDQRGLPKPRIHYTAGENEKRMTAHADRTMRAIWETAGGKNLWAFQRFAHTIGTCRMGHDAQSSVVNAFGRSHEIANLYVCDNSVFPSALSVNPALTIMALALRTADAFLQNHAKGQ